MKMRTQGDVNRYMAEVRTREIAARDRQRTLDAIRADITRWTEIELVDAARKGNFAALAEIKRRQAR